VHSEVASQSVYTLFEGVHIDRIGFLVSRSQALTRLGGVGLSSLTPCAWCLSGAAD